MMLLPHMATPPCRLNKQNEGKGTDRVYLYEKIFSSILTLQYIDSIHLNIFLEFPHSPPPAPAIFMKNPV
jgi:hypothetical protein